MNNNIASLKDVNDEYWKWLEDKKPNFKPFNLTLQAHKNTDIKFYQLNLENRETVVKNLDQWLEIE